MIEFKTLENTSIDSILDVFNESFSDYSIPFHLNLEQLESKLKSENINLQFSVGAFEKSEAVGFILHGTRKIDGKLLAYNAGTGVIPSKRGNGITTQMYDYIKPKIRDTGFSSIQLEVISDNVPAIKSYEKTGFTTIRKLNCYKGEISISKINPKVIVEEMNLESAEQWKNFWDCQPTWQNSLRTIQNLSVAGTVYTAKIENQTRGYLVFNKTNNRIIQLAVAKNFRRNKIGSSLVNHISTNFGVSTSIINVDATCEAANLFFKKAGLNNFLQQNEMYFKLR